MTDQQIEDAYERLGTALTPPPDAAARVERRVAVRRRRRRIAVAGVTGLVVAGAVGGAVLLGSGDRPDGKTIAVDQPTEPPGSFVVTRTDGSTYTVDDLTLSCDKTANGDPAEPGRIYLYSPFTPDASGERLGAPFLYFDGIVDRIDGKTFTLPHDSRSGSSEDLALVLFTADSEVAPGESRANEVSSSLEGAAGTVRVLRASCAPTPVLVLEADATLASEVQQGAYTVVGSFG